METQALARGAGLLGAWGGGFLGTWRSLPLPGADVGFISVEALRKTCEAGCLPPSLQGWSPRCEAGSRGVWGPPPYSGGAAAVAALGAGQVGVREHPASSRGKLAGFGAPGCGVQG